MEVFGDFVSEVVLSHIFLSPKYYDLNNVFESDFVQQALKMSISTFERYNSIRNNKSYAHDNDVLNKAEATYVVTIITATLTLIHKIENQ